MVTWRAPSVTNKVFSFCWIGSLPDHHDMSSWQPWQPYLPTLANCLVHPQNKRFATRIILSSPWKGKRFLAQNNSLERQFPVQQRIDGLVISFRKCLSESKAESLAFRFFSFQVQTETDREQYLKNTNNWKRKKLKDKKKSKIFYIDFTLAGKVM